jgi:pimeloyl-ACP methyl ester carboxylesterase
VATFGSYADLVGLVQAVTTGISVVDGRRLPWDVPDQAAEVLPDIARALVPPDERDALSDALSGRDPAGLPVEARAVHALLTNRDPLATPGLARRLGPTARTVFAAYSPAAVAGELVDVPVLAAHSRDDPAVPYAELLRLQEVLPHADTLTVASFDHVNLEVDGDPVGLVRDLVTSWTFVRNVLAVQERWPWQR